MADQPKTEREEPQRTSADEDRIRGVADQEDEEFEEDEDLEEETEDDESM